MKYLHNFYTQGKSSKKTYNRGKSFGYQILGFGSGVAAAGRTLTQKAAFAYGQIGSGNTSLKNLVNSSGVVAADVTGVGTARRMVGGANYGTDKGIIAYGYVSANVNMSNLVSNSGVIAADVTGVGTARRGTGSTGLELLLLQKLI